MSQSMQRLTAEYEEEKRVTMVAREEVIRLLSHDESSTRRQLSGMLRRMAEFIDSQRQTDEALSSIRQLTKV
jgi:hypothetical protein